MLIRLGRWSLQLVVLFFAAYAFGFVPLGRRTALEHLVAILQTREAQRAAVEVTAAAERLRARVLVDTAPIRTRGTPTLPALAPPELSPPPDLRQADPERSLADPATRRAPPGRSPARRL